MRVNAQKQVPPLGGSCFCGEASIMLFVTNARLPVGWAGLTQSWSWFLLSLFNQAATMRSMVAVIEGRSNGYGVFEKSITVEAVGL